MKRFKDERGFTLIELVVVMVILGVLAAIAIPKFVSVKADAEKGTASGVTGALRGAVAVRHSQYLMDNSNTYDATTIGGDIETEDCTVGATGAAVIQVTFPGGNTYTWTYTARTGNTPGKVTKSW